MVNDNRRVSIENRLAYFKSRLSISPATVYDYPRFTIEVK